MTDTVIYTLPRQRVSGYHEGTKFTAVSDVVTHEMNEENSCEKMYYFTSISGIPNWCTPHTFYLSFTLHVCSPPHKFTPPDFFAHQQCLVCLNLPRNMIIGVHRSQSSFFILNIVQFQYSFLLQQSRLYIFLLHKY